MEYTNIIEQLVFLRDADIVNDMSEKTISGNIVSANGIPSYSLFRAKYNELSAYDSNLCAAVDFLLSTGHDAMQYKGTIPHYEPVSPLTADYNLSAFLKQVVTDKNGFVKRGFLYRLSTTQDTLSDYTGKTTLLGSKDFFIINKDTALSTILFEDLDIFKNSESDVKLISSHLCAEIDALSTSLSDTTRLLVAKLQNQIILNDNDIRFLSSEVDSLSDRLSIEIDTLSTSLSDTTRLSVDDIQSLILSNDADINFLSNVVSTDIKYNLSALRYYGNVILSDKYDCDCDCDLHDRQYIETNTLYGLLKSNAFINKPTSSVKAGYVFRTVGNELSIYELSSDLATISATARNNEYFILNKDIDQLSNISLNDVDIIKDYDLSVKLLKDSLTATIKVAELSYDEKDTPIEDIAATYGIAWNSGDIIIVKVPVSATDDSVMLYTAYVYAVNKWEAMYGNYSAENVFFREDITLAGDYTSVGNIKRTDGTLPAAGKSVKTVFSNIFTKRLQPADPTQPAVSITASTFKAYEVGTKNVETTYSGSCSTGSYTYGPTPTGVSITGWSVKNNTTSEKSTSSSGKFADIAQVIDTTSYYITMTATYTEGKIALDNLGDESDPIKRIAAGSKFKDSGTITGYRNTFYGSLSTKDDFTSAIIRGEAGNKINVISTTSKLNNVSFNVENALRVFIAVPLTKPTGAKGTYNVCDKDFFDYILDENDSRSNLAKNFTKTYVNVSGANGYNPISYSVYYMDFASKHAKDNFIITQ